MIRTEQSSGDPTGLDPQPRATLVLLLRGQDFRRLLAARVLSQLSDGVFQVSLASYVIFSPERQSSPADIASVLAVMLVPFSVIGPFTGVLLDRWQRRQVLHRGNLARSGLGLVTAALVLAGAPSWLYFAAALLVTALNRFILAGLSAALPRVVRPEHLVTANAVSPTLGTVAATLGGGIGFAVHLVLPPGPHADTALLAVASVLYLCAALAAQRMAPGLLGPESRPDRPDLRQALGTATRELTAAVRHLVRDCRPAAHALVAMTATRFGYGVLVVVVLMLSRYSFSDPTDSAAGLTTLGKAVAASAAGFFLAAVVSPWGSRRFGVSGWLTLCLASAALFVPALGLPFRPLPTMVAALLLGLVTQAVKIATDTLVQSWVEDDYRGRVFALYDVLFNLAFVAAAATAAVALPLDGRSRPVVAAVALLYGLTAAVYARTALRAGGQRAADAERPAEEAGVPTPARADGPSAR